MVGISFKQGSFMKQDQLIRFISEDYKIQITCEDKTTLGALHDFLISVKSEVVNRIQELQKSEEATKAASEDKPEEIKPEVVSEQQ